MTLYFINCSGYFSQSNERKKANGKTNTKFLSYVRLCCTHRYRV